MASIRPLGYVLLGVLPLAVLASVRAQNNTGPSQPKRQATRRTDNPSRAAGSTNSKGAGDRAQDAMAQTGLSSGSLRNNTAEVQGNIDHANKTLGSMVALLDQIEVRKRMGATPTAQAQKDTLGHQDTPLQANGKWHVHDGLRPQPPIIDPGTASTQDAPGRPPSDAVVLFDGTDLSHWKDSGGGPAAWKVEGGHMEVTPKTGSLLSKDELGDCQLHVEWSAPTEVKGSSQGRGNSGVLFFGGHYEVQVLDSYENKTYPDGQAGSIYGSYPPIVNAMRRPGEWNVYDIMFTVPRFSGEKLVKPGYFTVMHNGVVIQNHVELLGDTTHMKRAVYHAHPLRGPLMLQNHGNPVRFRNIWYRELKDNTEPGDKAI